MHSENITIIRLFFSNNHNYQYRYFYIQILSFQIDAVFGHHSNPLEDGIGPSIRVCNSIYSEFNILFYYKNVEFQSQTSGGIP